MEKKPFLPAIDYIRGISMMGVIGIHVGSQYLMNPSPNLHLVALFEIFTRFSVPIFFFISAFGLFYNLNVDAPFQVGSFYLRRLRTVFIPFFVWSLFYIVHDNFLYQSGIPSLVGFCYLLFFGTAKYQLYFMVLLLWFYLFMPLWVKLIRKITLPHLIALFFFQVVFDYWSSFHTGFHLYVYSLPQGLWKDLLLYRLNYWVLHYIFIFLLGGYLAVHFSTFQQFYKQHLKTISLFFLFSMLSLLGYYYVLLFYDGYTPMDGINTAHQLSPAGICYTLGASIFYFAFFSTVRLPNFFKHLLSLLGKHSYFVYLAHPLIIAYLSLALEYSGRILTAPLAIAFYLAVLFLTLLCAGMIRTFGSYFPIVNQLTIGIYKK